MTLRQKQSLFAKFVSALIIKAYANGYEVTLGDAHRSEEEQRRLHRLGVGVSPSKSCHPLKLAIDLHLFKAGRYLSSTESHRFLGEWWEQRHPLCRWGGRFGDGNHYSMSHGDRA